MEYFHGGVQSHFVMVSSQHIWYFFLPIYVYFFSVTPSLSLVVRDLWWFFIFRTVINFHTAVIVFEGHEMLPDLIEVYCQVEEV